ncbi:MAG: hypothetical protein ABSC77_07755 [Terracidiphilus sp.]
MSLRNGDAKASILCRRSQLEASIRCNRSQRKTATFEGWPLEFMLEENR